jgi:hypothetical protein
MSSLQNGGPLNRPMRRRRTNKVIDPSRAAVTILTANRPARRDWLCSVQKDHSLAKIITAVCLWSEHPHWSPGDACRRQVPSQSENWQRFNSLALQPCNLAMSKKSAKNQIYVNSW